MKTWQYFKWGAKNHPGNPMYIIIVSATIIAALGNENIISGLVASAVVDILLLVLYVLTSISVGKANKRLVEKENV